MIFLLIDPDLFDKALDLLDLSPALLTSAELPLTAIVEASLLTTITEVSLLTAIAEVSATMSPIDPERLASKFMMLFASCCSMITRRHEIGFAVDLVYVSTLRNREDLPIDRGLMVQESSANKSRGE
jgi:hypothetical protein